MLGRDKGPKGPAIPDSVQEKLRRGREALLRDAAHRRLCTKFWKGDQYWYLNEKNLLNVQSTVTHAGGGGKPPHRIRNTYNFIHPIVEGKVSAATQRVPSYEIVPSTTEPEDIAAARLGEKVAIYGYDKWMVRRATTKAVTLALVEGEAFVLPYFDTTVGPFIDDPENPGKLIGQGEVRLLVFSANEVYWEPGCDFYSSPWHVIERARPIDEVEQTPGYFGGKLSADATTADIPTDKKATENMVLVTEYLERPCPKYPEGRRLIIANGRVICPAEDYPGDSDSPVLHRLSYVVDPSQDRDRGLVSLLIDLQRTAGDCWNKLLEWKNRCLNPQMIAAIGSLVTKPDDVPGSVREYRPMGGAQPPQWEQPPAVPRELFEMLDLAITHMRLIAADVDVQAEPDLAARTAQAAIEQSRARWQSFIGDLAEFHSRIMRHCLQLVQRHYSEPRQLQIQGTFGPDLIPGFMGADLRGQADVRVNPGSIETRSRKAVLEETMLKLDRQLISPQAALAAIDGGIGEKLGETWQLDVAKANQVIQKIKQGPEVLFNTPERFDAETMTYVPGWMPRRHIDNVRIWLEVFSAWMKAADFDRLDAGMQEAANQVFGALRMFEQEEQIQAAMQQEQMAVSLGQANAARPQRAAPSPDQRMPSLSEG